MQLHLHSSGAASRLAALLLPQILPGILGRHALPAGRIAALGATMDLHHGLLDRVARRWSLLLVMAALLPGCAMPLLPVSSPFIKRGQPPGATGKPAPPP